MQTIPINKIFDLDGLNKSVSEYEAPQLPVVAPAQEAQVPATTPHKKRGRPRKNPLPEDQTQITVATPMPGEVVVMNNNENSYVPICQTNDPYQDSYGEAKALIRGTIAQIDQLSGEVKQELDTVRSAKTLKGKYTYISELCETAGSLISTKLSAIKEINSITSKCHDLEMKRFTVMKDQAKAADDDRYMADMYAAYINTPISAGANPFMSQTSQNTIGNPQVMGGGVQINANGDITNAGGYDQFIQNLSPEQNRMMMEGNPNIETVVVYDQATGNKMFDVVDMSTGMSVPNYPRPNPEMLADTNINFATGIASNSNLGQTWKVMVLGDPISNF